ncbi:hypothetical protein ACFOX0_26365, partial [Micromonospora zhanjiangensis]
AESAHAESAHAESAHAESAHAESAHAESAHAESAHAESAHAEPAHAEPAHAVPAAVPGPGRGPDRPARRVSRPGPPGRRDPRGARRRNRLKLTAWALTVAAAVLALTTAVLVVRGGDGEPGGQPGLALVATGAAPGGVSLAVSVTGNARGSTAQVTVTGLQAGTRYRLYAVTHDGVTHEVRDWTGAAGTQQVTGELTQSVDSLAFFSVGPVDGPPIVTAAVGSPAAAPPR